MSFGGHLSVQIRWMNRAELDQIEEIYAQSMSRENGCIAIPACITFGTIFIKELESRLINALKVLLWPFKQTRICSIWD